MPLPRRRRRLLDLAAVHELASGSRLRVTPGSDGRYQLALLLYDAREPVLVATGALESITKLPSESRRELHMLEKWLQAVSDRLRLADQLFKSGTPSETRAASQPKLGGLGGAASGGSCHVPASSRQGSGQEHSAHPGGRLRLAGRDYLGVGAAQQRQCRLDSRRGCLGAVDYRQVAALLAKNENPVSQVPILY